MKEISCILMATLALATVMECKDIRSNNFYHAPCSKINCLYTQDVVRTKRDARDAANVIGSVGNLVTGVIDSVWKGIERVQRQKRKKNVIIGPGRYNKNKVYINRRPSTSY